MTALLLPIILAAAGLVTAAIAYQGIRRGGARFYTLEREAMLRRASLSLLSSVALFLGAVGLLVYDRQQEGLEAAAVEGEAPPGAVAITTTPFLETAPPTPTATPDMSLLPTVTPTPLVCRAVVSDTGGNGLTLRDTPGGAEMDVLDDGSVLTLVDDEGPIEANGLTWRKVRAVGGDEGWVAQDFLTIRAPCQ